MKKIITIILFSFILIPFGVKADEASRIEKLNLIPTTVVGDVEYLDAITINPDIVLADNRCVHSNQDIIDTDPERYAVLTPELEQEIAQYVIEENHNCEQRVREVFLDFSLKKLGIDMNDYYHEFEDSTHLKIIFYDANDDATSSKDVVLRYKDDNPLIRAGVDLIKEKILNSYDIYGLAVINSVVHYGGIDANLFNSDLVLYRFPELKELLEENPDYDFSIRVRGAGSTPTLSGNGGFIGVIKDGVLYDYKATAFYMNHILYVDEDEDGTIYEKAEKRISEYLNNKYEVNVDTAPLDAFYNDPYVNTAVNEYLGTSNERYVGVLTDAHIGDVNHLILIVEIPKSSLDVVNIKSKDLITGINIKTSSSDVSLDTQVVVEDVKNEDYVIKAIEDNKLNIISAYDINLKQATTGTLFKNVADGVEVYIPVTGYKNGDTIKVYYIKSDSSIGETLTATVVTIDEVMYAKFKTNHFSTYALGNVNNPSTGDSIYISLILVIISFGTIIYTINKRKVFNK